MASRAAFALNYKRATQMPGQRTVVSVLHGAVQIATEGCPLRRGGGRCSAVNLHVTRSDCPGLYAARPIVVSVGTDRERETVLRECDGETGLVAFCLSDNRLALLHPPMPP